MVIHFMEEHEGRPQEIHFRVTSKHQTPLDRQVQESVNIEEGARSPRECLNLKNEWAGSKLPGILVQRPKGVMRVRQNRGQTAESSREGEDSMHGTYTHRETEVHTNGEPRGTKRVRLQQQGIGQWTGGIQRVMWTQ